MKLSTTLIALVSVAALLTACDTKTGADAGNNGNGTNLNSSSALDGTGQTGRLARNVGDRVFFDYDSSTINAEGEDTLQKQAEYLKKNPGLNVVVEGHCDERGTREYNLALGERRANAARNYLVNLGVESSRIQTISYGKERPAVVGDDEAAWSQNRRAVTVKAAQ